MARDWPFILAASVSVEAASPPRAANAGRVIQPASMTATRALTGTVWARRVWVIGAPRKGKARLYNGPPIVAQKQLPDISSAFRAGPGVLLFPVGATLFSLGLHGGENGG